VLAGRPGQRAAQDAGDVVREREADRPGKSGGRPGRRLSLGIGRDGQGSRGDAEAGAVVGQVVVVAQGQRALPRSVIADVLARIALRPPLKPSLNARLPA